MSEPSKRIPSSTYDDTAARKAVEQLIARRAKAQQWPRRRIEELLEALGLREYPDGGRIRAARDAAHAKRAGEGRAVEAALDAAMTKRRAEINPPPGPQLGCMAEIDWWLRWEPGTAAGICRDAAAAWQQEQTP